MDPSFDVIFYLPYSRDLEEALEMGMDWSLREGQFQLMMCFYFQPCNNP